MYCQKKSISIIHVTCSAFGDMVYQLANLPNDHRITAADLLKSQQFHEIQFLTEENYNLCLATNLTHPLTNSLMSFPFSYIVNCTLSTKTQNALATYAINARLLKSDEGLALLVLFILRTLLFQLVFSAQLFGLNY